MNKNASYALITGASQGLGKALSTELASRNFNLLLTALPGEGLKDICEILEEEFNISTSFYEVDLSSFAAVEKMAVWAAEHPIQLLINNAGLGGTMPYETATPEYIERIIQLNISAPSILTRLLLPTLRQQAQSYILNISSMAAFSPMAYKTVYPASKAFIWSFSRGLYQELKGSGVFVGVIHPGPIKTNPDVCRRIEKQKFFGKIGLLSPEQLAFQAIDQILKQDSLLIPGVLNKINWLLMKTIPIWLQMGLMSKVIKRELAENKSSNISYI